MRPYLSALWSYSVLRDQSWWCLGDIMGLGGWTIVGSIQSPVLSLWPQNSSLEVQWALCCSTEPPRPRIHLIFTISSMIYKTVNDMISCIQHSNTTLKCSLITAQIQHPLWTSVHGRLYWSWHHHFPPVSLYTVFPYVWFLALSSIVWVAAKSVE